MRAEYKVADGVWPPGDVQYPFAAIAAIISGQLMGWPISASTLAAASKALSRFSLAAADAFRRGLDGTVVSAAAKCHSCQDAFIAWLIAWARRDHREANGPLHRTGVFFLGRLLGLHGIAPPTFYTRLKIRKYKHIDILVKVNKDIVVLIEDKVDFIEHSGQLKRYLDIVRENCEKRTPVPVYLKTGEEQDYSEIEKAGWKCFLRRDMLEVLDYGKQQGVESDIFRDFRTRMRYLALRRLGAENGTP